MLGERRKKTIFLYDHICIHFISVSTKNPIGFSSRYASKSGTLTPFILIQGISQPHAICQSPNASMQGQTPKTKGLMVDQKAPSDVNNSCSSEEVLASAAATCRDSTLILWDG